MFLPASRRRALSLSQRLTGQVANRDPRAPILPDYTPRVLRTQTIDGEGYYALELNPSTEASPLTGSLLGEAGKLSSVQGRVLFALRSAPENGAL